MYLCHFQSQDAKSNSTWDLINILKFCYWIYIRASMSMTDSHMPCHRAFHWEEFYSLFTDYCSLSLSRYLFSKTVSSICKQNWKKYPERERKRIHRCQRGIYSWYKFELLSNRTMGSSWTFPDKMVSDSGTWSIHIFII